jgi:plastocyanin
MTQRFKRAVAATAVITVAGGITAAQVFAGPEQITFPHGFEKWQRYAVVDRHDTKQYRELYASPEVVKAVREGKPIPNGTVLVMAIFAAKPDDKGVPVRDPGGRFVKDKPIAVTVMEKRAGWGASVPEAWRNGDWQYASFTADAKPNEKANANIRACFECHLPHAKQDFVMSLASLSGTALGAATKPSGPGTVAIAEFLFGPQKITVKAGQTITWTNVDDSPHQVTVQGESTLRTPVVLKGQSTSLVFNDVGSYGYICGLHPSMKGTIEVTK